MRVRIALCTSVFVANDAISASVRLKLELLRRARAAGLPVDVTLFTQFTDDPADDVVVVQNTLPLLSRPDFMSADLHVYEFGIWYPLFDSVFIPTAAKKLAVYHNVTPVHLVQEPMARLAVTRTHVQQYNLFAVDHVVCDSEFNKSDLLRWGYPPERATVLHLPSTLPVYARDEPAHESLEFLYVGRLVRSKGILDLLNAVDELVRRGVTGFRVSLVGNVAFSDLEVITAVREAEARHGSVVRFVGELDDEGLARLFARSDVLVIPSYHEGFCVPVVEALAAGCKVIAYDSSNLPNVTGGFATLVSTGDVEALANGIALHVRLAGDTRRLGRPALVPTARGLMPEADWERSVAEHLTHYSLSGYERTFVDVLGSLLARRGDLPAWWRELTSPTTAMAPA